MTDEGMECPECGESHNDWEKDGQHAVNSKHHSGTIKRYECGNCGNIVEVPHP